MGTLTTQHANIIQRALLNEHSVAFVQTAKLTRHDLGLLSASGIVPTGCTPNEAKNQPAKSDWTALAVVDKSTAEAAIQPFGTPVAPVDFQLKPIEQETQWADYNCPSCGATKTCWSDGDTISVPVLPEGIRSYGEIDAVLMVGHCKACKQHLYVYEFGFSTVDYPDDPLVFCVVNIEQEPDVFQAFQAKAAHFLPWVVTRMWFTTGKMPGNAPDRLPNGPFVVDYHQFGPFMLDHEGELTGANGVSSCSGSGDKAKWAAGEFLFRNLAGKAMQQLHAAARGEVQGKV